MKLSKIVTALPRKYPAAPFVICFGILVAAAGIDLSDGRKVTADSLSMYAFFILLAGIVLLMSKLALNSMRLGKNKNIDEWIKNE